MSDARVLLRHVVATLAYRGGKSLRDAPAGFGDFQAGEATRTPLQILTHMGDLMDWVLSQAAGSETWSDAPPGAWDEEVDRFFRGLAAFDDYLESSEPLAKHESSLFQGALADALTHVGQINMLRRLAGSPVRGENYSRADVQVGRVGPDQTEPRREFD